MLTKLGIHQWDLKKCWLEERAVREGRYGSKVLQRKVCKVIKVTKLTSTRMWANDQRDGRPAEYRLRPLFNAAKFG